MNSSRAQLRHFWGFSVNRYPPYCPDNNKIERIWQDLHASVTRNHRQPNMTKLMEAVRYYLNKRNRRHQRIAA